MTTIRSFAELDEDVELLWLAGFAVDANGSWLVRTITKGLTTGKLRQHLLPIGLLPLLAPGRCFIDGRPAHAAQRGGLEIIGMADVGAGEVVTSDAVPPEIIGADGRKRGVQRLLRYRCNGLNVLVPCIEMVRYLFIHNKTMANALMRPGGLMELCRPEQPGFHPHLHLHFTGRMPRSVLKPTFVTEFAWTAVHPEGRRSWDSVAELSTGKPYVLLRPPRIGSSIWTVRAIRSERMLLVLELLHATGRKHPCDTLSYSHPSVRKTIASFDPRTAAEPYSPAAPRPPREVIDYVVDDGDGSTRTDVHQSVLPAPAKGSSFDRIIKIVQCAAPDTEAEMVPTGLESDTATSRPPLHSDRIERRQVRVRAGVGDEGIGGQVAPIEFELLEPADPGYCGSLEPLISVLQKMAALAPHVSIAMALCVLKAGRAISYAGRHRRPCLVAVIRARHRPPMVLLDVDHTDDASLSSLVLTFHNPVPLLVMEQPIKALLDGMVANSGRWDLSTLESFADTCGHMRLPKVLRHQKRMDQAGYHKAWALRLIDRLKLGEL